MIWERGMKNMDEELELESIFQPLEKGSSEVRDQREQAHKIFNHAKMKGLCPQEIFRIVKACLRQGYNSSVTVMLIKSLVPRTNIPEDAVICALSRIFCGKIPPQAQKLLLEWIAHNFYAIYPKSNIFSLYGMLLNILDNDFLRSSACHLLCLMTKSGDISYFRIYQLAWCQKRAGNSIQLRSLLKLYQSLAQRTISGHCLHTELTQRNEERSSRKLLVEPPIDYGLLFKVSHNSCSLMQKRHMIAISSELDLAPHLDVWLHYHLSRCMENPLEEMHSQEILLSPFIVKDILQVTLGTWAAFLYDFIETWNGCVHREMILNFIANVPLHYFVSMQDRLFEVIRKIFMASSDILLKCEVLNALLELTCTYITDCTLIKEKSRPVSFIKDLVSFVEEIVLEHLLSENDMTIFHSALEYWEMVSYALLSNRIDISLVPHFYLIYKAVFGISSVYLSSICETLHNLLLIPPSNSLSKSHQRLTAAVLQIHKVLCRHIAAAWLNERGFLIKSACQGKGENSEAECTMLGPRPCFCLGKHPSLVTHVAVYADREGSHPDFTSNQGLVHFLKSEGVTEVLRLLREHSNSNRHSY